MSLHRLRAALSTAEFTPHTLTLGSNPDLASVLPPAASAFLKRTWPGGATMRDLLAVEPWDAATMADYKELAPDERVAVLAFVGFPNHELVHRVDFLSTPFGVAFQGRACLETIGLLLDGAELIAELEHREPSRPLRDIPPVAEKFIVSEGVEILNARVRWFDALRGAAPKYLQPGWMSDPGALSVANVELERVMVHELMPTLLVPGGEGAYVRPLTVLESRAVALTGLLLLNRLGGDGYAAVEVARFLETFYTPREAFPDYRFLLDLFTGLWGRDDLPTLAEGRGSVGLTAILKSISVVGWYGLHASPEAKSEALLNASPILRVVVAMRDLLAEIRDGNQFFEAVPFLNGIDTSDQAAALGLTSSRETLAYCSHYLTHIRRYNAQVNPHPELLEHFEAILSIQQDQINRRLEYGYSFAAGMPDDGSVLSGLEMPEADERLFFEEHGPPAAVHEWFRLREMLLFRHARPPGFWPDLWRALGTHPGVSASTSDAARELALTRARFVAGGIWPIQAQMRATADGGSRHLVPVRRSNLPATFTAVASGSELTVNTKWSVFSSTGDPLVALQVSFPETGEEIRLLFSLGRHREVLQSIEQTGRLAIISEAAYTALQRGEAHPEIISFQVTAHSPIQSTVLDPSATQFQFSRYEQGWSARIDGREEELLDWAVEAYAWRDRYEAALFFAELKSKPPQLRLTLDGLPHPDAGWARMLTVTGPATDVRRFRDERIPGTGAEVHMLTEADARDLIAAVQLEALEALTSRADSPVRLVQLKPVDVRLD